MCQVVLRLLGQGEKQGGPAFAGSFLGVDQVIESCGKAPRSWTLQP